jgi:DNA-binding winged helix-turn-helix (wHTH) protein
LPSLVSEIREALDDRRRHPRLIRTVHGFGYAFQSQGRATPDGTSADTDASVACLSACGAAAKPSPRETGAL